MFYLIDEEGTEFEAPSLNELMKKADNEYGAYGDMSEWTVYQGTKIEVERNYVVKNPPKAVVKKVVAKKPVVKKVVK